MILLVGDYSVGEQALVQQTALCFGVQMLAIKSEHALSTIGRLRSIRGVILDPSAEFAEEAHRLLGSMEGSIFAPIVETPSTLTEETLLDGLRRGAVGVFCREDVPEFVKRVQMLCSRSTSNRRPTISGGVAIAHEDPSVRLRLMRAFRTAGYKVNEIADASSERLKGKGGLLVVSQAIWFEAGLAHNDWDGTVILQPGNSVDGPPQFDERSATLSEASNPYDVVFAANELRLDRRRNRVKSTTVVHSRICTIRTPGGKPKVASIYNMSSGAIFISSMVTHKEGSMLWVEFHLPQGEVVHLRGRVSFSSTLEDTLRNTPPGFELTIDDLHCPRPDLALYKAACAQLIAEMDGQLGEENVLESTPNDSEPTTPKVSTVRPRHLRASSPTRKFQSTYLVRPVS